MPRKKQPADAEAPSLLLPPAPYTGTILDAMTLAGMVGKTWDVWRVFWKAVFALPMTAEELVIFQRHTNRQTPPAKPVREAWQPMGRRAGKSRNSAIAGLYLAIRQDYREHLAPGEVAVLPVIGVDHDQAAQVMRFIKGLLPIPTFAQYLKRELMNSVEFTTGVSIEVATASYRTTRGFTNIGCIADEIAFWRSEDSAEPDSEVLRALRPGMATIPDSLILALSSPYAQRGELYRAVKEHFGKESDRVLVWNADSQSMHADDPELNATVAQAFIDDPVVAASEYGQGGSVVFRSDVESFVDASAVEAVTIPNRRELPKADGIRYFAFTDPSGGSQDAWTLAIAHLDTDTPVLDAVRDRVPPFSPAAVVEDYAHVCQSYDISDLYGDHYGGEFPRELFRRHGITYRTSDKPKSDIYKEWLPLLNAGRMELLDSPKLKAQFCGLERKVARSGQDSIDHAPGGHDDIANAVAGVLVRAARKRPVQSVRFAI